MPCYSSKLVAIANSDLQTRSIQGCRAGTQGCLTGSSHQVVARRNKLTLFAQLTHKMVGRVVDPTMEAEARAWIEAVIGEGPLEGTLQEALKSGVVLCNLINKIKPGTVKKINKMKMPFMQMENIAAYLTGCKDLGVPDFESFQTVDLFEDSNMKAVVLNIHSLGRTAQKLGFAGPTLGVKESAGNKREFTEEQLNAGKNIVPTFGMGSHVSAQEDAKAKLQQ